MTTFTAGELDKLSKAELLDIAYELAGVRIHPGADKQSIIDIMMFKHRPKVPPNPINKYRDTLIKFIASNRTRLSMPCHGRCYEHTDGQVVSCHIKYKEDNAETSTEDV